MLELSLNAIANLNSMSTASTCFGSGFEGGQCCDSEVMDCSSADASCACDTACFDRGDCCEDIIEHLGCYRKIPT